MLDNLEALGRQMELKDEENREIIREYSRAVKERTYQSDELKGVIKRYPSIRGLLEKIKDDNRDPIDVQNENLTQFRQLKLMSNVVTIIEKVAEAAGEDLQNDKDYKLMKDVLGRSDEMISFYEGFCPIQESYYLKVAKEVKDISASEEIDMENVIQSQDCQDEIGRRIFPERENAENFTEIVMKGILCMMDSARALKILAKKSGMEETIPEDMNLLPTEKATNAFVGAMRTYSAKEFDRIYGDS